MENNYMEIDGYALFNKAFNGIADITNSKDEHVGAVLGFFYQMINMAYASDIEKIRIFFKDEDLEKAKEEKLPFGYEEELLLVKRILEAMGLKDEEMSLSAKSELVNEAVSEIIAEHELDKIVSWCGGEGNSSVKKSKRYVTSDFNETENIFNEALKKCGGAEDKFVGIFLIQDEAKKDSLQGIALCCEDELVNIVKCEGFITADYLSQKLQMLSDSCRLTTFDIKKSYHLFTPKEIEEPENKKAGNFDVLIGAYLVNPLKNDYEPWDIAKEYLHTSIKTYSEAFGKSKLSESLEEIVLDYAAAMAHTFFAAAPLIEKALKDNNMLELMRNVEMPLSYILYDMERVGIIAKRDELKVYSDNLKVRIDALEKDIIDAAGVEFNINSPKQLAEVLFEKLQLPGGKKTKSGYSTAADVLEKLAPDHKIVRDVLEYRGLAKLKSTYADGLAEYIEADGRIHTNFNQTITATGRISSTEPNLQNIPMRTEEGRSIRKVFVPKEGYVFADADYSQIELRILAHMSGDNGLIEAYHEGRDIHRITASKVFNTPFEEVTDLQRRNAKAVNFGIVYGMSTFGLSEDLSISRAEAKEYMEQYFATYPGVQQYQERAITEAKEKGYAETIYGRRRPMPELKSGNYMQRQFGERVAMNAPIQGTAADIMKIAMINVWRRLKKDNLKSELILQIHDELVIETAPDEVDVVKSLLESEMENAVSLKVPLDVECHTGKDWYESK
ncbi:MAG: DNA polymerase I [Butyrivibrio sp.]|nr:DNA polymerase I [Butyrivibrio sp.]